MGYLYAPTIRIYLRHHTKKGLHPTARTCRDWTDRTGTVHRGCGFPVVRYATYPNQKTMLFNGPPRVVDGTTVALGDGGIVARVYTDNVHFATCSARTGALAPGRS